jgi:hypothetical protein
MVKAFSVLKLLLAISMLMSVLAMSVPRDIRGGHQLKQGGVGKHRTLEIICCHRPHYLSNDCEHLSMSLPYIAPVTMSHLSPTTLRTFCAVALPCINAQTTTVTPAST